MIFWRWFAAAAWVAGVSSVALADDPPKAVPGWGPQAACIGETDIFVNEGGPHFKMSLTNKCEAKLTCRVWGYIVTARGPTQGAAVLHLAPKSKGAEATGTYMFHVKVAGGSAEVAHRCKPE